MMFIDYYEKGIIEKNKKNTIDAKDTAKRLLSGKPVSYTHLRAHET